MLTGLVEPVQRYFSHATGDGAALPSGVRMAMSGRTKVGLWLPFTAQQTLIHGRARVGRGPLTWLRVTAHYADAGGRTEGRLLGRVTLFRAHDANMARRTGNVFVARFNPRLSNRGSPRSFIADIDEAVGGPRLLSDEEARAQRVLDLVPQVPTPVWGRDELKTGDMWNSNSVIAWLIARSGIDTESIHPPTGGRAPGWQAGLVPARRQGAEMPPRLSR